jgi:hypothetical protein
VVSRIRAALAVVPLVCLAACQVSVRHDSQAFAECDPPPAEPLISRQPSMMAVAHDLDHVEKHIDWHGSVTAKAPDVWGEARLTKYRQEIEKRLLTEIDSFRASTQGTLSRTDIANLTALMSFAGTGQSPDAVPPLTNQVLPESLAAEVKKVTTEVAAASEALKKATGEATAAANALKDKTQNPTKSDLPPAVIAAALGEPIAVEPVRLLDQKNRYLSYLTQLRRTNEGDDTSDAPGYSLNLIRVPVSVLPGKKTDTGYGAEVTFTLTPTLTDELLPATFRDLLVNDVGNLLSFVLTPMLEDADIRQVVENDRLRDLYAREDAQSAIAIEVTQQKERLTKSLPKQVGANVVVAGSVPPSAARKFFEARQKLGYVDEQAAIQKVAADSASFSSRVAEFAHFGSYPSNGKSNQAMPPALLPEVIGPTYLFEIARLVNRMSDRERAERDGYMHLPAVQAVLKDHLLAAHRFLSRPEYRYLWDTFCSPELAEAVRSRKQEWLNERRAEFRRAVRELTGTRYLDTSDPHLPKDDPYRVDKLVQFSATSGLAWALLVDAALLNERLYEDMKRTAAARPGMACPAPLAFHLPDPPPDARRAFADYVKVRWPVHVFTLDPLTEDQNQDDDLQQNRTTQYALTLAFARGGITSRTYINAMRTLTAKYQTIALNRTQVGFAHGNDVFGWRFYPRFQTPPVRGNISTFVGGNILGLNNPNDGLRQRRLEPGPRECTAVVLMPSFVPYATLDVTGNWFALANPKHKVFDHTQALRLSRTVQAIRIDGCGVRDAHKYRDGDAQRLQVRAEQLAARLPLQTHGFQVPVLNTLGGFELFGTATTDLAPELYGWYGAPGIATNGKTALFLVGDHFSVNQTKVLVGNREVSDVELISRQVMKVTVPCGVVSIKTGGEKPHVHIHLATPYGVSRELKVPVICEPDPCPAEEKKGTPSITFEKTTTTVEPPKPEDECK